MKLKFALVAAILLLAVSLFAYEDGFLLGGNNCGTKYFNEDISRSFNKVFDVAITFNSINNANALISDRVGLVLDSNRAYAYDLKSGKEMWKYPADKELDENITSKPFSYDGKIYFTTLKVLYCLDEISGKILWRKNITETMGPVFRVSKGVMFMTSDDGKIYRISPESGEDVASPLSFKKTSPKNSLLIKDNYVVVTTDNSLTCYDLKKDKEIYTVQIPATASSYSPLISNDYIIVPSEESVVIYSIDKGKEKGRRKMPNSVSATPVTDGKYIYVACSDSKIYTLGFDKKLTMAGEGLATANIVDNFIALSDEAFIVSDSKGLITAYSLADQSVVWQFQPGMYSQGGVTAQIPGIGTADITAQTEFSFNVGSGNGGGQGMGRGGQGMGGR
ncbi:MAG: PQQ-binding-like beta-propeller repeat protein, partial [Armatimonadetes bacterium]|nr:PQQ-binding-like beta-propeller repeat protein [Candidatus Hippobium faecium]